MYTLRIKVVNEVLNCYYQPSINRPAYEGDSGIDLYCPVNYEIPCNTTYLLDLGIQCEMIDNRTGQNVSYYLYPRSSISKKNLILHNSIGIIDAMYRGNIKAPLRCISNAMRTDWAEAISIGERYVQICAPNLAPINIEIVTSLSTTERGDKGFGSSGK